MPERSLSNTCNFSVNYIITSLHLGILSTLAVCLGPILNSKIKKCSSKYTVKMTLYIIRAETRRQNILFNLKCTSGNSNFSLLCACLQMITKVPQGLFLGLPVNFSEYANSQIHNLQTMRTDHATL